MSSDFLVDGGTFSFTNFQIGTTMWRNSITDVVMGYLGYGYVTYWRANQFSNGTWIFRDNTTGSYLGLYPYDKSHLAEGVTFFGVPEPMVFDVWPDPDNLVTINIHNTNLLLQLEHPWGVPGIPVVLANAASGSTSQSWIVRRFE